jgi:DNA-binding CsgD family transcriptional regulator
VGQPGGLGELERDPTLLSAPTPQFETIELPEGRLVRRRDDEHRRTWVARAWGLSPAQLRVLDLVVQGQSNKEVASVLGIAEGTVEAHLSQIFRRSGASSRAELGYAYWTTGSAVRARS